MVMPVSRPVVQFACVWILSPLTFIYKPADSPTEPIAAAAKFFQDNHFPANQVLDSPRISTLRGVAS